jgi:hypothetical protein
MIVIMGCLLELRGGEIECIFFIGAGVGIFCILHSLCQSVETMARYGYSLRGDGCIFILFCLNRVVCR